MEAIDVYEVMPPTVTVREDLHAKVDRLERAIVQHLAPVEIEPVHYFADGTYAREITIPAGSLLTGKIHKTQHLNIISAGSITVWSPGEKTRHIVAPFAFVAEPGTRRVGFAHEDTVWTTIHATEETDLERLELQLIEPRDVALLDEMSDDDSKDLRLLIEAVTGGAE
jgi:hypothetical protein